MSGLDEDEMNQALQDNYDPNFDNQEASIDDLLEYDEENNTECDMCGGNGMYFEGDVHMGDCPECCGGTL